jgi:hypothetical protein
MAQDDELAAVGGVSCTPGQPSQVRVRGSGGRGVQLRASIYTDSAEYLEMATEMTTGGSFGFFRPSG